MAVKFISITIENEVTSFSMSITIFFKTPMYKYIICIREYNCVNINIINIPIVFIIYI